MTVRLPSRFLPCTAVADSTAHLFSATTPATFVHSNVLLPCLLLIVLLGLPMAPPVTAQAPDVMPETTEPIFAPGEINDTYGYGRLNAAWAVGAVPCEEGRVKISGLLWVDSNGDGLAAPDEPLVPDHRVCAEPMSHRAPTCGQSDSEGNYFLCVLPGTYLVAPDAAAPDGRAGQWGFRLPAVVRPGSTSQQIDLGFLPAGIAATPNCIVDLDFDQDGVLPSSQGSTYIGNVPEGTVFSSRGGMLHLNTLAMGGLALYQRLNAYDPSQDFLLEFRMKVYPGTGLYGVDFEVSDHVSDFELGFADDRIALPPPRPIFPFVTTDDFHTYRMVAPGGTTSYRLFIDGNLVFSGSITAPGDPSQRFAFGDGTNGPNGQADIDYIRYCQSR